MSIFSYSWYNEGMLTKEFIEIMQTDTVATAKALLGMNLVLDGRLLGRIVETEAYLGSQDSASHSANGRRSPKNESMYLPAGHWYVYQIYGHQMLNLVTRPENVAEAVLIRALEPLDGSISANGPGKLTRFAGIDKSFDGQALESSALQLQAGALPSQILSRPRIGVTCTDEWREEKLGFYVANCRHVSHIVKSKLKKEASPKLQVALPTWQTFDREDSSSEPSSPR